MVTFGGYQIVGVEINGLVGGHGNASRGYALDLGGMQEWIEHETEDKDSPQNAGWSTCSTLGNQPATHAGFRLIRSAS